MEKYTASAHHGDAPEAHRHSRPELEAIIGITRAAEFLRQKVDQAVEPLKITGVQYNILRILKRAHPQGLSRTDIVRQLIEKSVDVTRSIDGLAALGFVERARDEQDRRLSISTITDAGIEALQRVDPMFFEFLGALRSALDAEEFQTITRLCDKLCASDSEKLPDDKNDMQAQ